MPRKSDEEIVLIAEIERTTGALVELLPPDPPMSVGWTISLLGGDVEWVHLHQPEDDRLDTLRLDAWLLSVGAAEEAS